MHKGEYPVKFTPDRKMVESLRRLPDEPLWRLVCGVTAGVCGDISKKRPDINRTAGIRAVLDNATDEDICRLNEFIDIYNAAAHRRPSAYH